MNNKSWKTNILQNCCYVVLDLDGRICLSHQTKELSGTIANLFVYSRHVIATDLTTSSSGRQQQLNTNNEHYVRLRRVLSCLQRYSFVYFPKLRERETNASVWRIATLTLWNCPEEKTFTINVVMLYKWTLSPCQNVMVTAMTNPLSVSKQHKNHFLE